MVGKCYSDLAEFPLLISCVILLRVESSDLLFFPFSIFEGVPKRMKKKIEIKYNEKKRKERGKERKKQKPFVVFQVFLLLLAAFIYMATNFCAAAPIWTC